MFPHLCFQAYGQHYSVWHSKEKYHFGELLLILLKYTIVKCSIYYSVLTFCSLSWVSRISAVWPTVPILSSLVSILVSQASTSCLFDSYLWESSNMASNWAFLCRTLELVSSQCSLSLVTKDERQTELLNNDNNY